MENALTTVDDPVKAERANEALVTALACYEDFTAEAGYSWAEEFRLRLRRRIVEAVLRKAIDAGDDESLSLLTRAAAIDPNNEEIFLSLSRNSTPGTSSSPRCPRREEHELDDLRSDSDA